MTSDSVRERKKEIFLFKPKDEQASLNSLFRRKI